MALTALPQSALPRDPQWDEAIVPALRKRLENESNALAKRMSAASIYEDYTSESFASNGAYYSRDNMSTPTSQLSKPSAIPRPSMQHSRTADFSTSSHETSSRPGSVKRSRTFSQPVPFEPPLANGTPYPPIDITSRANSPTIAAKNTRIPISRNRTGSISSYKQPSLNGSFGRADGTNGVYKANGHLYSQPEPMPELWPVTESQQFGSHSTLKTHITQTSELVNEPSPFVSSISSHIYEHDYAAPRMSTDSEERPFEHWYRGDVSRNGGVGELRVGRKQEMLDIANYGHTLRQASSRTAIDTSSRSRSNSRGRETVNSQVRNRPRAGSVPGRESIYIDTQTPHDSMVLDERPPTDFDSDGEHYDDQDDGDYMDEDATTRVEYSREHEGVASPLSFDRSDTPTTLVDKTSAFKSRIPTPTPRQISESPSTPAQSPQLGTTESSPATYKATKSSSQPPSPAPKLSPATGSASAKRRAKAPVVAASTTKKTRTKSPAKPVKRNRDNEDRRSVAHYPSLEGDDVVHAIPSWTQPVPSSGNWDDVVLPVVARKKGLEGQYEHADGSPKPKPTNTVIEPAPGTFGFDHSKYRPPRINVQPEGIQMNEFGQRTGGVPLGIGERPAEDGHPSSPLTPPRRLSPSVSPRPESPAPFAHYAAAEPIPQIRVTRPSTETQKVDMEGEEGDGSGCCARCVIM